VRRAFTDQINATEGIEYSRFADWKFGTSPTPTTAPELASSRSLIDGLNHTMVRQFSLQWPTLQSPSCVAELALVKAKVADQRQFDTLFRQALDVATQSYCSA
jgi:chorismate mutase